MEALRSCPSRCQMWCEWLCAIEYDHRMICWVGFFLCQYVGVWEIWRFSASKTTGETIEMAINGLIESSGAPRWPRELCVCHLCFLSEISQWSAADWYLREEFSWKKSFNKARTIFSFSARRKGHRRSATTLFLVCRILTRCFSVAASFSCSRGKLVTSISPKGAQRRQSAWWEVLETGVQGRNCGAK